MLPTAPHRIVITGGPGSGKTVITQAIAERHPDRFVRVPEAATHVYTSLNTRWDRLSIDGQRDVQRQIYHHQREQEERLPLQHPEQTLLLDRGTIDGAAYWPDGPEAYWLDLGTTVEAELSRYDAVIVLESGAALGLYDGDASNACRFEDAAGAIASGKLLERLWGSHREFRYVNACGTLEEKIARARHAEIGEQRRGRLTQSRRGSRIGQTGCSRCAMPLGLQSVLRTKTITSMTRRFPIASLVIASLLIAMTHLASAAERPNIIVILSDDMGFSDLGCYGSEIQTPNLDALAADGVRFTQFYNTARCCPSRAALLSGLYSHQAGVGHMTEKHADLDGYVGDLNDHCVTIAQVLKPAGYGTYMVGKLHITPHIQPDGPKYNWPLHRGFDRYYGTINGGDSYFDPGTLTRDDTMISAFADPQYSPPAGEPYFYTNALGANASRFIEEHHKDHADEPFFMYCAFTAAHWPMQALPRDIAKYKGKYDAGYGPIRQARFEKEKKLGLIDPKWDESPIFGDWSKVPDKDWEARCMEVYAASIDCMDQNVGHMVDALKKTGQYDNTLILFMQDNGGNLETVGRKGEEKRADHPTLPTISPDVVHTSGHPKQTRDGWPVLEGRNVLPGPADTFIAYGQAWANVSNTPFREYKHFVHEGGIATPLIAHWPAHIQRKGALETQPGHLIDIMATCVDVAGAKYPTEFNGKPITPMEGTSLVPAFDGQPVKVHQIFWEHEGNRAMRDGDWKLVATYPAGAWELYNMAADRTEMHDLAKTDPDRLKSMITQWEAWGKRVHALPWPWEPQYGESSTDDDGTITLNLKPGDDLGKRKAPKIVGKVITITATLDKLAPDGVIIADGGLKAGYSLFMKDGHANFTIRSSEDAMTITSKDPLPDGTKSIIAKLAKDGAMTLSADDKVIADGKAPRLIDLQPVDGLQVGQDKAGNVGDYQSPFPFTGVIKGVKVEMTSE